MREVRRSRRVRLGDVAVSGRLRLDALARYLQDVAWDDVDDAFAAPVGKAADAAQGASLALGAADITDGRWIVRRIELAVSRLPRFGDEVELATSCIGVGSRWAERRTHVTGATADVESSAIWVHLDVRGRPAPLDPRFASIWGDGLPRVSARLTLPGPPPGAPARDWPLRTSDVDVLGHVNNAIAFAAVEDEVERVAADRRIRALRAEYRDPIDPDDRVGVVHQLTNDELRVWLVVDGGCRFAAQVALDPSIS